MCGIFGAVKFEGFFDAGDFERFVELTDMVSYRGPDDSGHWLFDSRNKVEAHRGRFNIFLGHRRLSIIDLSEAGHQPFTDNNGLWITYNGEVFNYIELKRDLQKRGQVFKTETDTEVILAIYREFGEEGFNRLNGMWAFALVDVHNQRIILSRDRFSIKPLYIYQVADEYYFASEIKQLLPILRSKNINHNILYKYLRQGLADFNCETFFEGILKIKAKHNVIIDLRKRDIREDKYWDYFIEGDLKSEDDVVEQFVELFSDSINIRLRSDVPLGCLLSGGLDSSSIAVVADKMASNGISTYSVVSSNKKYSEEHFVDIISDRKNIRVTKLFFEDQAAWDSLGKVLWHQDEPFGGFSVVAQHQILALIKNNTNIKVMLSGQGGDEVLCGYRKYFFNYLKETLKCGNVLVFLRDAIASLAHRTVLWQFSLSDAKRYIKVYQQRNIDPMEDVLLFRSKLEPMWSFNSTRDTQIQDLDRYSVPVHAHFEDRNAMAYGIEVRHPFLDHRLVNFLLNISVQLKIKKGWSKYVLRKSIKELPPEIAWRRDKQGFVTPEEAWLKYDFKDKVMELFSSSRLSDMGLVNKEKVIDLYDRFLQGSKLIPSSDISRLIIAELWVRMFFS